MEPPGDFDKSSRRYLMGGVGSGGWNRRGRGTVETHRAINIGGLQRGGGLQAGWKGSWTWTGNGTDNGRIGIEASHDRLRLTWRVRQHSGAPWQDADQVVAIRWRPCRFGGHRPFFACPGCDGDRLTLYLAAGCAFVCRRCLGLTYASQRERERDRLLRRADRLRIRLGSHPGLDMGVPGRPRHMRHATYQQLAGQLRQLELAVEDEVARMMACCAG